MLRIDWKGKFQHTGDKHTVVRKLGFNSNTLQNAHAIIEAYAEAQKAKGWNILSNEVEVGGTEELVREAESDDEGVDDGF